MIDFAYTKTRRRGAYALLILVSLCGLSTCTFAQDSTYNQLPQRVYEPLRVTYDLFSNVRSTNAGIATNTNLFLGVRSGNVSLGIGSVRQQMLSVSGPDTRFNAFTPQIRVTMGTGKFFYFGPSSTQLQVDKYTETAYGIEVGLFMSRF